MKAKLNLRRARRTNLCGKGQEYHGHATIEAAWRFEDAGERLTVVFFAECHTTGANVCGTWVGPDTGSISRNWHAMNNLNNCGNGPGQAATWSPQHGVHLAARWFLNLHNEGDEERLKQERHERAERRAARQQRQQELFPDGLKGGTGDTPDSEPLFKRPAA